MADITHFLAGHPGGAKAPRIYAGDDATEEFIMLHKPAILQKQGRFVVLALLHGYSPCMGCCRLCYIGGIVGHVPSKTGEL